ncbi:MAG: S41 family peptidase [Pseudohongiella sp.]|nr:S41 family peptidase [Pseudohongiella sp.]
MSARSSRVSRPGFFRLIFACLLAASVPVLLMLSSAPAFAQSASSDDSCQPLIDTSAILSVVTEQFYDRSFNGLNWSSEVADAVESTECDDSPDAVTQRVNALLSRLEASHTAVYSPQDLDYWGLNSLFHFDGLDGYTLPFPGIWATRHDNAWFATYVLNGSSAEQGGIRAGDELISLNGKPFAPTAFVEGDNQLEISSDGNTSRTLSVTAPVQSIMRAFVDASAASAQTFSVDSRAGEKSVAYYRIWAARDQIQQDFQAAIERFTVAEADALIVDLRGGFGGTSEEYLASIRFMLAQRPIPVYFLIDDTVRSGKELLAGVVRRDQLGTLLGSTTAGYYLAGRMNRLLNDRYFLYVAVNTFPTPGTGEIEGVGVAPDIEVLPCREHCNGQDPVLERALQLIAE